MRVIGLVGFLMVQNDDVIFALFVMEPCFWVLHDQLTRLVVE
jgi:hypothetical protein